MESGAIHEYPSPWIGRGNFEWPPVCCWWSWWMVVLEYCWEVKNIFGLTVYMKPYIWKASLLIQKSGWKRWKTFIKYICAREFLWNTTFSQSFPMCCHFDSNNVTCSSYRFDPDTKQWSFIAAMTTARSTVGVAVLNGRLYAVGGRDGAACLNSVECYDPHTNKWSVRCPMLKRRGGNNW